MKLFADIISFRIPHIDELFIDDLEHIDNDRYDKLIQNLNIAKDQLNQLMDNKDYRKTRYHGVVKYIDTYLSLKHMLKSNIKVCTNATFKIHEILKYFNLLENTKTVFCNAELPGAFISTIYRDSCGSINWFASSYIPTTLKSCSNDHNDFLDDVYGIYKKYPQNWLLGPCNGDILKNETVLYHESVIKCDLYTSDVGIDVSDDYNSQEESTLYLNYSQIVDGLFTLNDNGKLVTKQYTFSNPKNRSIMTVLAYLFREFYIVKPQTSRPYNSEIYLVCKGFIKSRLTDDLKDKLLKRENFKIQNDDAFYEATKKIHLEQQISFLNEIIEIEKHKGQHATILELNNKKCRTWIKKYPFPNSNIEL